MTMPLIPDELAIKLKNYPIQDSMSHDEAGAIKHRFSDILNCSEACASMRLPFIAGIDAAGTICCYDMAATMPHLVLAGSPGHGMSSALNVMISAIMLSRTPLDVRFLLIDPLMVEFYPYERLKGKYLVSLPGVEEGVITDIENARLSLYALWSEMKERYLKLNIQHSRNLKDYNKNNPENCLPDIVLVIGDYTTLRRSLGEDIEKPLVAILQLGRGVGIHVVLATPKTSVLSVQLLGNLDHRIAFKLESRDEATAYLGKAGAERLMGAGNMLLKNGDELIRIQSPLIEPEEIDCITEYIADKVKDVKPYTLPDGRPFMAAMHPELPDPLLHQAAIYLISQGSATVSSLQRKFHIGYNRAAKIMDQLEDNGVIGKFIPGKPRDIRMTASEYIEKFNIKI